ncbi:MAG: nucleotidyl transferase AbiEii/AbiGii toxin family protein [Candidatus Altiarchaeota archaeon]|nr:nucleotidyl transferase AbiEii/AbiGii toxin family protein [Candidatus Altiarchaeota archaeon]
MKIHYTLEEKESILDIIDVWRREQLTQKTFRDIQEETGIPPTLIETMFWHLDTLHQLTKLKPAPIFKGGTCVQNYIPPSLQRASNDLDFNSRTGNPNTIIDQIKELNKKLLKKGNAIEFKKHKQKIRYGTLDYNLKDERSGTVTFSRRMPSRLGEYIKAGDYEVTGKNIRIQINYKHAWLPALQIINKEPGFFILKYQKMKKGYVYPSSSPEDLITDKILATMEEKEGGRERLKDIYDLMVLLRIKHRKEKILEKLEMIAERKGNTPNIILKSSSTNISKFVEKDMEAQGFKSLAGVDGKKIIENWETNCIDLVKTIQEISKQTPV